MKLSLVSLLLCFASVLAMASASPQSVELGGAVWKADWTEAQVESLATGKPVLMLDLVGRLDEKWC